MARRLGGICTADAAVASFRTLVKETVKGALAQMGCVKYAMHGSNAVLRRSQLRDGHPVKQILRCNPHPQGLERGDTATGLAEVITPAFLGALADRRGVSIVDTHLGKTTESQRPLPAGSCAALRRLAHAQAQGRVLVTTTRRLLDYCDMVRSVSVDRTDHAGVTELRVTLPAYGGPDATIEQLAGLSLQVATTSPVRVLFNRRELSVVRTDGDAPGLANVYLPWPRLEFPTL